MTDKELLPCPFCGGAPKTSHRAESKVAGGGHAAFIVCYCGGYASTAHQMGRGETVQAAIAEVIEKWNRRAQPAEVEGVEVVGYTTAGMIELAKELPRTGRIGVKRSSDERYNVPLMTVVQHLAALSAVTAERERLRAALSAPDTITAEPAGDYDSLRKQFLSLRMLANNNAKMVHHWRDQCGRETRETLLANAANVNAERDTNSMLTDALEAAEAERDQLRAEVERLQEVVAIADYALARLDHKVPDELDAEGS